MSPISPIIEQRIRSAQSDGRLSLSDLQLSEVPGPVWTLSSQSSDLGWWQKSPLVSIDLSHNNLVRVDIPDLDDLQHVNLSMNRLPSITIRSVALISLNLSNNQLQSLPDFPASLTSLNVTHNDLESLGELPCNLTILHAAHNRLVTAPNLPLHLQTLDLSHNQLSSVSVSNLSHLTTLNLSCNQLIEFSGPSRLRSVDLSRNRLRAFPDLHAAVIELNLSCNRISDVTGIEHLHDLHRLDLSDNQIKEIPPQIAHLTKLVILNLRSNDLNDIPSELGRLHGLAHVYLTGNPLRRIRSNVRTKGTETLKQYLIDRMAPVEDFAAQKLKPIC